MSVPAAKAFLPGAGDDQHAGLTRGGGDLSQPFVHRKGQGIARLRPVERDVPDAIANLIEQFVSHVGNPGVSVGRLDHDRSRLNPLPYRSWSNSMFDRVIVLRWKQPQTITL